MYSIDDGMLTQLKTNTEIDRMHQIHRPPAITPSLIHTSLARKTIKNSGRSIDGDTGELESPGRAVVTDSGL